MSLQCEIFARPKQERNFCERFGSRKPRTDLLIEFLFLVIYGQLIKIRQIRLCKIKL